MEDALAMLPIQEEKIRKIFAGAKSFAVVSSDETAEEAILAKEALAAAIKSAGLSVHSYPERQKNFADKWLSILPATNNNPPAFSTSILIPKNKTETKEISYTEDDRYVSINISASEEISKENVIFKTLPAKVDAIFYFPPSGQNQLNGELPEELSKKITAPEPDSIITVASSSSDEAISGKALNIIQVIESSGDVSIKKVPVPDLLLASLFVETDQFQKNINEETLELASSLMKLGANKEKITNILNDKSPSFARLLGRALARSYPNKSLKSMWTFIADKDLEKTGNEFSPALFGKIMRKIKGILEPCSVFVLIWQSKQEVWAMVSMSPDGSDAGSEEKIRALLSAKKEEGNLISGPYKNFSEAELKIQRALKEPM